MEITVGREDLSIGWYRFGMALLMACVTIILPGEVANGMEITPFRTGNMAPLVQIHGLPVPDGARILDRHEGEFTINTALANNYAMDSATNERVIFDGETYRLGIDIRYGVAPGVEAGIEVPFVAHSSGFLDGFIEGFHKVFNFTNGGRENRPRYELLYRYESNGIERFRIDDGGSGIGDVRLTGGIRLYDDGSPTPRRMALRGALKLPTGDSGRLRGSGGIDFALWLAASDDYRLGSLGHLTIFANMGGAILGKGDVLRDQQRDLAGSGTLGLGWSPVDWMALTVQTTWHSSLYRGSRLRELQTDPILMTGGFGFALGERTSLEMAVSEDLNVKTSPDVTFYLAMRNRF